MKQIFNSLQWAFIACQFLFVFTACQEDHTLSEVNTDRLLHIEIAAEKPAWVGEDATRITDNGTTLAWEAGDKLHVNIRLIGKSVESAISAHKAVITRNAANTGWSALEPEVTIPVEALEVECRINYFGKHNLEETVPCFDTPVLYAGFLEDLETENTFTVNEFKNETTRHRFTGLPAGQTLWLKANEWEALVPSIQWFDTLSNHFPITIGTDGTVIIYAGYFSREEANIAITNGSAPDGNTTWYNLSKYLSVDKGTSQTIDLTLLTVTPGGTTGI